MFQKIWHEKLEKHTKRRSEGEMEHNHTHSRLDLFIYYRSMPSGSEG